MKRLLLVCFLFVLGCEQRIIMHPIEGHVYFVPQGIKLETKNQGTVVTQYPGVWFSEWYVQQLWKARIEQK